MESLSHFGRRPRINRVGMPDSFGESGEAKELLNKYGITADHIVASVRCIIDKEKRLLGNKRVAD